MNVFPKMGNQFVVKNTNKTEMEIGMKMEKKGIKIRMEIENKTK